MTIEKCIRNLNPQNVGVYITEIKEYLKKLEES